MKQVKRIFAFILAALLALAMALPALAADVKITNSVEGQTYTAYKIFDVSQNGNNYAYTMASDSEWKSVVESFITNNIGCGLTLTPNISGSYNVTISSAFNENIAKSFATYLNTNKEGKTQSGDSVTGTGSATDPISITGLDAGYYFITSSLGSLCMLHTTSETKTINEKNEKPDIAKTADKTTASVGETVTFTLTVTAGGDAATSYIVHDTMSSGLKLKGTGTDGAVQDSDFTVTTQEGDPATATPVNTTNYTIKVKDRTDDTLEDSTCIFEITFPQTYTSTLSKGKAITITYSAVVQPSAVTTGVETNKAKLQYGNSYSAEKQVEVKNYGFSLVKTTSDKAILSGAQFEMYTDDACTQKVNVIKVGEGADAYYRPIADGETAVDYIEAGNVKLDGFASKTYYLKEINAPAGYNPLAAAQPFALGAEDNWATVSAVEGSDPTTYTYISGGLQIVNQTGSEMPETGGIGTTIFYVLGSILLIGAGILLVTRKRMNGAK